MESVFITYLPALLSLAALNLVTVISPGPDFAIIVRNSLIYSRRTALFTALGIALGTLIHVSYSLLGLGLLIRENEWLLMGLKYLGGGYLLYIGLKGLCVKKKKSSLEAPHIQKDISPLSAIRSGFLTNALNPKCMLFFVSLISVIIPLDAPWSLLLIFGLLIFLETFSWFALVALCLSSNRTREKFNAVGHWVERTTGGFLVGLSAKLFLNP